MRIISGSLKGRKLHRVQGKIRPTSDRVRESIFNILGNRVLDSVVIDLFAGTGALGIESLSRGAKSSIFIDKDKHSISLIKKNLLSLELENRTKVICWDIVRNLNCVHKTNPEFDLIFMDPPYGENAIIPSFHNLIKSSSIKDGACIVIEHSDDISTIPNDTSCFMCIDQRKYGKTLVSFFIYDKSGS